MCPAVASLETGGTTGGVSFHSSLCVIDRERSRSRKPKSGRDLDCGLALNPDKRPGKP